MIFRVPMRELLGKQGERRLSNIGMEQMLVSMGHQSCGAVELWNYPTWIRNLIAHDVDGEDRPDPVDMAAMEGISLITSFCITTIPLLSTNTVFIYESFTSV